MNPNKFSSFRDGILNKFTPNTPNWECCHGHPQVVNKTIRCANCNRTIWDSDPAYKVWLNLILVIVVIGIISVPVGGFMAFVSLKQYIKQLQGEIHAQQETIGIKERELQTKEQQLKEKQTNIEDKDGEIKTLNDEINNRKEEIKTLNTQITNLQKQINAQNKQMEKVEEQINAKQAYIEQLKWEINDKNAQIQQLQGY
jgi:septal ring factor EnvC (AmiA/AmiB activator)